MAPKRRIRKLAALVDAPPEMLVEVIGDVFHETVGELQAYERRADGRIARGLRRHRKTNSDT